MADTWDLDGYFKIDAKEDGVYLTVYAPMGSGEPVEASSILAELDSRGVGEFDGDLINQTVHGAQGVPVKIAGEQAAGVAAAAGAPSSDLLVIEVSEDEMTAYLTVLFPGGENLTVDDVKSALSTQGVTFGIDEERASTLLKEKGFNKPITIAKGTPPVPGQDAVINFKFRKDTEKSGPKVAEDGKVDYRKLDLIENATVGQVLATKLPPTKGKPGKTVTGSEVEAPDGEDVPIPAGKNTEVSSDGLGLTATVSGQAIWTGARIDVESTYEIKGDVDFNTGDIDFVGSLIIGGNVTDGFTVKVTGDIEVKGCIEMAEVTAGGDITVQQGILGKDEGNVFAEGDITAKFIENSNVEAMGDVIVQETIMHSNVDAGERIILAGGKRGVLLGGKVRAGKEVNARTIGNWMETPTEIEVGVAPRTREEILKLEHEVEEDKKKFKELKLGIKILLVQKDEAGSLPPEKEELWTKHLRAQNMFMRKLRDTMARINILQKELSQDVGGKVSVSDVVYPATKISIRTNTMYVREEYKFATFFSRGNKIEFRPYEEPKLVKKK